MQVQRVLEKNAELELVVSCLPHLLTANKLITIGMVDVILPRKKISCV